MHHHYNIIRQHSHNRLVAPTVMNMIPNLAALVRRGNSVTVYITNRTADRPFDVHSTHRCTVHRHVNHDLATQRNYRHYNNHVTTDHYLIRQVQRDFRATDDIMHPTPIITTRVLFLGGIITNNTMNRLTLHHETTGKEVNSLNRLITSIMTGTPNTTRQVLSTQGITANMTRNRHPTVNKNSKDSFITKITVSYNNIPSPIFRHGRPTYTAMLPLRLILGHWNMNVIKIPGGNIIPTVQTRMIPTQGNMERRGSVKRSRHEKSTQVHNSTTIMTITPPVPGNSIMNTPTVIRRNRTSLQHSRQVPTGRIIPGRIISNRRQKLTG